MCISQFRRLCQASEFRHGETNRQRDLQDANLRVKKGTHYYKGRSHYYVTNKAKLKGLEGYINAN